MNKTFSGFSVQKIHVPYPFHVAARRSASSVAAACDCDSALLKKPGLDAANMANYRPVSHLSFISKVVERAVAIQLNEYLAANDLLPRCSQLTERIIRPKLRCYVFGLTY